MVNPIVAAAADHIGVDKHAGAILVIDRRAGQIFESRETDGAATATQQQRYAAVLHAAILHPKLRDTFKRQQAESAFDRAIGSLESYAFKSQRLERRGVGQHRTRIAEPQGRAAARAEQMRAF